MDMSEQPALMWALELWRDWLRHDAGELRKLWYPAKSVVLEPRKVVTEDAWQDLEDEMHSRVVQCVQSAVESLNAAQRGALERSLGLCAVVRVRNQEERLQEAYSTIWRVLLAKGAV